MLIEKIRSLFKSDLKFEPSPELTTELRKKYGKRRALGDRPYACYAPLKNMYFGHEGKVVACCYNRDHVIGYYPQQSIKEIWNGKKATELREHLMAYNFTMGCQDCLKALVAENFDGAKSKQYDTQRMNKNHFPSVLEFELDDTCNLECIMCNGEFSSLIRAKREKRPPRAKYYDDKFIEQLEEFIPFLEEVKFYGGEPFLIPAYFKIWDKIIELNPGVRISVQTNGTTVNSRVKEILQKTSFHVSISIDSLNKELYESIRVNSHFETVMDNLQYFYKYCKERDTFFGISACIMQQNWFEAPDFIRFCNQLNVPVYFHTVTSPKFASLEQLSKRKLNEIYAVLIKELDAFPEDNAVKAKNKKHYRDFLHQILDWGRKRKGHPETVDIDSVPELQAFIEKKINQRTDIDDERKAAIIIRVNENMQVLETILPADASIWNFVKALNPENEAEMKVFLDAAENGQVIQGVEYLQKVKVDN